MYIYNIFSLFITFTVILLFFRLKITRGTLNIAFNEIDISPYYTYFLMLFLFNLILVIYLVIIYSIPSGNTKIFDKYKGILRFFAKYNIFYNAYSLAFDFLGPGITKYLVKFSQNLVSYSRKKNITLIFVFLILPRMLVILTLFLEVFIFKLLHYYFYSLLFLLVPLLFRFFLFVFTDLGPRLVPIFQGFFDMGVKDIPLEMSNKIKANMPNPVGIHHKLKPEFSHLDIEDALYNFYYPVLFLHGHMKAYVLPLYQEITKYTIFLYYFLQTIMWGYVVLCYF